MPRATATENPEHPFANVPDATYLPPTQRNVGAPPAKPKDDTKKLAYKTVAPVEDPKIVESVMEKTLRGSSISLTHEELFAISPEIRNKLKELLTPKRVADRKDAAVLLQTFVNPVLPRVEDLIRDGEKLPRGVLRIPDPFEAYLARLPPGSDPQLLTVAKESHSLRSIESLVDNKELVECVIDPGSQIVSMSEAVCHTLGLAYDPTIRLNMQSANGEIDQSLGMAHNVPFQVGELTLYLQVHVIRQAAYDVLLGRPFDVLTESVVRNFRNEDQTLTLHCPNSGIVTTVPTFARGKPRFRMPGF